MISWLGSGTKPAVPHETLSNVHSAESRGTMPWHNSLLRNISKRISRLSCHIPRGYRATSPCVLAQLMADITTSTRAPRRVPADILADTAPYPRAYGETSCECRATPTWASGDTLANITQHPWKPRWPHRKRTSPPRISPANLANSQRCPRTSPVTGRRVPRGALVHNAERPCRHTDTTSRTSRAPSRRALISHGHCRTLADVARRPRDCIGTSSRPSRGILRSWGHRPKSAGIAPPALSHITPTPRRLPHGYPGSPMFSIDQHSQRTHHPREADHPAATDQCSSLSARSATKDHLSGPSSYFPDRSVHPPPDTLAPEHSKAVQYQTTDTAFQPQTS